MDIEEVKSIAMPGNARSSPIEFAGRQEELDWLHTMYTRAEKGGAGLSCVIQDIPGTGKTSLAREFCKQAERRGAIAVRYPAHEFIRSDSLARRIMHRARQIASSDDARFFNQARSDISVEWLLGIAKIRTVAPATDRDLPLEDNLDAIGLPEEAPVVCFVDEAQHLPDEAKPLVAAIHLGVEGRPILPIYAGVSPRAYDRVQATCGSLRLDDGAVRSLSALTDEEVRQSLVAASRKIGVDPASASLIAERLAPEVNGFPSHIASAVSAVAHALLKHGPRFSDNAIIECMATARERRRAYYDARLRDAGEPPILAMEALANAPPADGQWAEREPLRTEWDRLAKLWAERGGLEAPTLEKALESCERSGAIRLRVREDGMTMFQFPAPSMCQHIREKAVRARSLLER